MPRPSKGDRDMIATRPPRVVGDLVRQRASEAGQSVSDYVASILAREVGKSDLMQQPQQHLPATR